MALHANTVFEIRTTGAQTNGSGFYNRVPGTSVDYSQQDAAQLSLSDIATDVAGTGLSSATGGFTAAMQGNLIYLTGGGVTAGWYEIISYTNGNNVTIDRSAGASKTGVTGNVGGAFKIGGSLDLEFFAANQKVAGNTIYVKAGTYTLGEAITLAVAGTTTAPITVISYQTTRGDSPEGNNRPTLDCGTSYGITVTGNYWKFYNWIVTGTYSTVWTHAAGGGAAYHYNCKYTNTSATSGRIALSTTAGANSFISCEFFSSNGIAVSCGTVSNLFINCYVHDSNIGISWTSGTQYIIGCIVDSCNVGSSPVGINLTVGIVTLFGSLVYGCTTGIKATTAGNCNCLNNIISGNTTGASWGTAEPINFWDFNCWNNTTDVSNVTKGPHDITADPLLNNPANGDFTLQGSSPCFDAGIQLGTIVGL